MYPSIMPARPKPLPRPCPQCGKETGGCQLVIFNPKYQELWTGYRTKKPYGIIRISHGYSKVLRTKNGPWDFTVGVGSDSRDVSIPVLFDEPGYGNLQSVSMPLTAENFNEFKTNGWPFNRKGSHWINKGEWKICEVCKLEVRNVYESRNYYGIEVQCCRQCRDKLLNSTLQCSNLRR